MAEFAPGELIMSDCYFSVYFIPFSTYFVLILKEKLCISHKSTKIERSPRVRLENK